MDGYHLHLEASNFSLKLKGIEAAWGRNKCCSSWWLCGNSESNPKMNRRWLTTSRKEKKEWNRENLKDTKLPSQRQTRFVLLFVYLFFDSCTKGKQLQTRLEVTFAQTKGYPPVWECFRGIHQSTRQSRKLCVFQNGRDILQKHMVEQFPCLWILSSYFRDHRQIFWSV